MYGSDFFFCASLAIKAKTFVIAYEAVLGGFLSVVQGGLQGMGFTLATNDSSSMTSLNVTAFDDNAVLDKLIEGWRALDPDFVACRLLIFITTHTSICMLTVYICTKKLLSKSSPNRCAACIHLLCVSWESIYLFTLWCGDLFINICFDDYSSFFLLFQWVQLVTTSKSCWNEFVAKNMSLARSGLLLVPVGLQTNKRTHISKNMIIPKSFNYLIDFILNRYH